ncbi:MAG: hypothetical protein E8A12_08585 [Phenylobacterium sp.]|nr:MAG: hypothetical protein E8A12_08585 [Phenylobacterium sp.]
MAVLPLTTRLLAEYITFRVALALYWANILVVGGILLAAFIYAQRARLLRDDVTREVSRAFVRRVLVAQSLYAFGALLCLANTFWSIGFIVLVQLNYAIAPGHRFVRSIE